MATISQSPFVLIYVYWKSSVASFAYLLPDTWETAHGLNPNDAADSKKINPSTGYAYVEEYFNGLVENVEKSDYTAPNPDVETDVAENTQYNEGDTVKVTATAKANNGGNIAKVEFYNGDKLVGTSTEAPYTCEYKGLTDGTYSITVRAYTYYNKG